MRNMFGEAGAPRKMMIVNLRVIERYVTVVYKINLGFDKYLLVYVDDFLVYGHSEYIVNKKHDSKTHG
jgi:hypothetical protein